LRWADTIAAAVSDASVIFSVVLSDAQLRNGLGSQDGLACMKRGAVLVQHTTCDPATLELIAREGAERGVRVLDAALSGGRKTSRRVRARSGWAASKCRWKSYARCSRATPRRSRSSDRSAMASASSW
jgi:hypothetical protein